MRTSGQKAYQQIPNLTVWKLGCDYVEAAEVLMECNRVQPAVVLAGLGIELFIKCLTATRHGTGKASTERGHGAAILFESVGEELQAGIIACSNEIDSNVDFRAQLSLHGATFIDARYWYEPTARKVLSSETIYFARHLADSVWRLCEKGSL
ncbi:MAG: hypothetical protein RIS44_1645 [Pseudomonadota bacterium]|jgi:hypothetical protein